MKEIINFTKAMEIAKLTGIAKEEIDYNNNSILLTLNNGDTLRCKSEYEKDYSDVTPGEGIQPPTFIYEKNK